MFKGLRKPKSNMETEPIIQGDLPTLCLSYLEVASDLTYNAMVRECGRIGNRNLRANFYIPPSIGHRAYRSYSGNGTISIDRTTQEICTHGRRLESVIARVNLKEKQQYHLAVLIDNSAHMTSEWQARKLGEEVNPKNAPHILVKMSVMCILESLGRDVDEIDMIIFGDDIQGPFNQWQMPYKEILKLEGSGLSRLDLALAKLLQMEWEMRPGTKYLFMVGGGLPESGTNVLIDDMEVQVNVFYYLNRMIRSGVKAVYFPFMTDDRLQDERVGAFSARGFANKMQQVGVAVSEIRDHSSLPDGLRNGFRSMMIGPKKEYLMFEM